MTGAALAFVSALAVSVLAQGAPAPPRPSPPAPSPDIQIPVTPQAPQPRAVCRMRGPRRQPCRSAVRRTAGAGVRGAVLDPAAPGREAGVPRPSASEALTF